MVRSRTTAATLLFCAASWLTLSVANLNANYKTEVQLAPVGNGHVPTYWEFLETQGVELASYFLPYHPNPLIWGLLIIAACAFFLPAIAARLAAHTPVRWLCMITTAGFSYMSFEVLLSYPAANRNGCEACDNVGAFQALTGLLLLLVAACSRAFSHRAKNHSVKPDDEA